MCSERHVKQSRCRKSPGCLHSQIRPRLPQVLDARAIGSNIGPCRGFGFVTMATVEAAAAAIKCVLFAAWFLSMHSALLTVAHAV